MTNKKYPFIVLTLIFMLSCNIFSSREVGNIETVNTDDIEMNEAIKNAQDTLPLFIEALQKPSSSQTDFLIKVKFPYGDGNGEHIWVGELTYVEEMFQGIVVNEPIYVTQIRFGDEVNVKISDISDWMIFDDNKMLGGFTMHVLRNRMSDNERKQFDEGFGLIIPDEPALP